jgi:hypothetical protein
MGQAHKRWIGNLQRSFKVNLLEGMEEMIGYWDDQAGGRHVAKQVVIDFKNKLAGSPTTVSVRGSDLRGLLSFINGVKSFAV